MSDDNWRREVDSKLISHDKDIHSIATSVKSIDESVKTMTDLHIKQVIRDEQFHSLVKEAKDIAVRSHGRIDEHDRVIKRVVWLIVTPVIMALLGLVIVKSINEPASQADIKALTEAVNSLK